MLLRTVHSLRTPASCWYPYSLNPTIFKDDLRATVVFSRLDMPMSEKKQHSHHQCLPVKWMVVKTDSSSPQLTASLAMKKRPQSLRELSTSTKAVPRDSFHQQYQCVASYPMWCDRCNLAAKTTGKNLMSLKGVDLVVFFFVENLHKTRSTGW